MDTVTPVQFTEAMIPTMAPYWCGGTDSAMEATEWICGTSTPCVRDELDRGTQVWVYENVAGDTIGFGSLGVTKWEVGGEPTDVQFIPMLGVFSEHQGCPAPESGSSKYCYQIVDHLIDMAELRRDEYPMLTLAVRMDNPKAIHVYGKVGFTWIKESESQNRMMLPLK